MKTATVYNGPDSYTVPHQALVATALESCPWCHRPLGGYIYQYVTANIIWWHHRHEEGGCCGGWMAPHPANEGKARPVYGPEREQDRGQMTAFGFRTGD